MKIVKRQMLQATAHVDVTSIRRTTAPAVPHVMYRPVACTFYQRRGKRLLDVILGTVLLVGLLPLMAAIALAVLVTSGWPVLHWGERIGKNRQAIRVWKFRTMIRDADKVLQHWKATDVELAAKYDRDFKLRDDPRVTSLGRFLRKSSLDELPQLWNVIHGDMSLVGPRPVVEKELCKYGEHAGTFLSVRPGITGRWQVNGRNAVTYPERIWVELAYCYSATLPGDLKILVQTLRTPFRRNGI